MVTVRGQNLSKTCLLQKYQKAIETYHNSNQTISALSNLTKTPTKRANFLARSVPDRISRVKDAISDRRKYFRTRLEEALRFCNFNFVAANVENLRASAKTNPPYLAEFILAMENMAITDENKSQIIKDYLDFTFEEDQFYSFVNSLENGSGLGAESSDLAPFAEGDE
jgi:hypothetical protein